MLEWGAGANGCQVTPAHGSTRRGRQLSTMTESQPDQGQPIEKPMAPGIRKRLQKYFEYGTQKNAEGDYDYAHAMFAQCVNFDPANLVYVEALIGNLTKKYEGKNKRKAKVRGNRGPFKKALTDEDWPAVLKQGLDLLNENPWDVATLRGMARACAEQRQNDERFNDVELRDPKTALSGDPKNIEVNRHCAESLARMGQFDQAIACWHRLEELIPGKGEAPERISELTVKKNLHASGLLEDEEFMASVTGKHSSTTPAATPPEAENSTPAAGTSAKPVRNETSGRRTEPSIESLEAAITANPAEVDNYLKLSSAYEHRDDLQQAEAVIRRALAMSGSNLAVRERLENIQIRRAKQQLATAVAQAQRRPSQDAEDLVKRMRQELNRLELAIFNSRFQTYPGDLGYCFELAVRLKRAGNFKQAAEFFQQAAEDARFLDNAAVQRGECLQQLRKYEQAMSAYRQAQKSKHEEVRKLAFYRAGSLAMGLKDWPQARQYFQSLEQLQPGYRDTAERLDKLRSIPDN